MLRAKNAVSSSRGNKKCYERKDHIWRIEFHSYAQVFAVDLPTTNIRDSQAKRPILSPNNRSLAISS